MEKQYIIKKFAKVEALLIEIENKPELLEYLSDEGYCHLTKLRDELFCLINSDLQQHEYSDEWFLKVT